jgi:hypothetical protein
MPKEIPKKCKCGAPCIINASSGFHLVFCEKEPDHIGDHSINMKDSLTVIDTRISWKYLGETDRGESGISYAPPLNDERCDGQLHIPQLPKLKPGSDKWQHDQHLVCLITPGAGDTGFCCEKQSKHDGEHIRSGTFGPLGMKWKITW